MNKDLKIERLIVLFLPWIFSLACISDALLSYFIAWAGSFLIFFLTLTGWVKPIPNDREVAAQLMRPIFILQIIFAGYMCCTSIFYMLNTLGYVNFVSTPYFVPVATDKVALVAQCQRYYCLGHAAFVSGILCFMKYPGKKKYYTDTRTVANLLLKVALISLPLATLFTNIPGLSQFSNQFNSLSFIAGTLALAFAIPLKKAANTAICLVLFALNFYQALTSGFKEPIIISIMVLGIFLYPNYKKLVLVVFGPVLFFCFLVLPAYVNSFREAAWSGDTDSEEAAQQSIDVVLDGQTDNWDFLVYRLSEIDMFITFVQSTPSKIDYYGFDLLKQSLIAIIPRVFWPSKPSTEALVMVRVYDAGVINPHSNVSAKPAYIVDGYLSGGVLGIFVSLFTYGAVAQLISTKAEYLFGGYILGTALIFSGLFQIFWRGLSFEFIINVVFWSYISMLLIHKVFLRYKILKKV
ncbi:hypothetical protein FPZ43_17150 [Mucilaginibacter pallidiroseus]|uniref:Oligosaccharide repeat unit polymerase n=1 Tax=Mucilaginibacter pallidiroseus TaxID=2599295 RepID=A0A563U0P3_9SPHI|nr:hypothetical protein [Mucilaginibacter pallidiroseus]TWR25198.1 hypothetical protein FPZ43_17150 [Mucilaginibacter pallidiroseus]